MKQTKAYKRHRRQSRRSYLERDSCENLHHAVFNNVQDLGLPQILFQFFLLIILVDNSLLNTKAFTNEREQKYILMYKELKNIYYLLQVENFV